MENNQKPESGQPSPKFSDRIDTNVKIVIAFFLGAILAGTLVQFALPVLAEYVNELLIGFIAVISVLTIIAFIFTVFKEFFFKLFFGISKADLADVKKSADSMAVNAVMQNWEAASQDFKVVSAKGSAWYAWLSYRRWVVTVFYTLFLAFAGLLGSVLLYNQNQLLGKQNDKIDAQIELEESSRRGNLIVMMSNVMDEISRELQQNQENGDSSRKISEQLIGRISALSYAFRPYRFWQDSTLIKNPLSPERGQLLLALVNSNLNPSTYNDIYRKATFKQASLDNVSLTETNLITVLLQNANLFNADLINADLSYALLKDADLKKSYLQNTNFYKSNLENADLREADLENTDLSYARLAGVKVKEVNWIEKLEEWEVVGADSIKILYEVDLKIRNDNFGIYHILKPRNK